MTVQEVGILVSLVGLALTSGWNIYNATMGTQKDRRDIEARVVSLETKMGLFWRLVEDNMTGFLVKSNPIQLTPEEQAAARIYDYYKSKAPTKVLKTIETAVSRELEKGYMAADERLVFLHILGAVQSQLYDRNEWTPPNA